MTTVCQQGLKKLQNRKVMQLQSITENFVTLRLCNFVT